MPTVIDYSRTRRSTVRMSRKATVAVAVVLAVFAILHVIGAARMQAMSAPISIGDTQFMFRGD
jgi:hypothetical protein